MNLSECMNIGSECLIRIAVKIFLFFPTRSFLHGYLHIEVHSAQNLPDMEGWMSKLVDKVKCNLNF